MKKILILLLSFILVGCTNQKPSENENLQPFTKMSFDAGFDTFLTARFYTETESEADALFNTIVNQMKHYHELFDIYNDYDVNNIKTINDNAGIKPVEVEESIIECLLLAKKYYDESNGEFDITMGALFSVWHNYREQSNLSSSGFGDTPSYEELEDAMENTGWKYVEIDEVNKNVYITKEGVSLDVGGIAKGFVTEKVAQYLENQNLVSGYLNFGGNNRLINNKPDGSSWTLGIQTPDGADNAYDVIVTLDGSISAVTSGDYQRYYLSENGEKLHHIIDKDTLFPATYYRGVTVYTKDSGIADALSTTLFTSTHEEGIDIIEKFNVENPDTPLYVVWVVDEDSTLNSDNSFVVNGFKYIYTDNLIDLIRIKP